MDPVTLDVDVLRLDEKNPRLPDDVELTQSGMIRYFFDHGALEELAESMVDNGYFEAERMIVLEMADDEWIVVEGNRRLATLKILHSAPEAEGLHLTDAPVPPDVLARLTKVPCLRVENRGEVTKYLAFRHIGGLKTWSPEAKARFMKSMIEQAVEEEAPDVFRTVGRRVGTNAQGVRNPFLALAVLEYARDEYEISTDTFSSNGLESGFDA